MDLSQRQKELLQSELVKAKRINMRISGTTLPEEKALLKKEWPAGGVHTHNDDNPFGMHRHYLEDGIDGAHTHSPQNPKGEHVHGEFEGRALITGSHTHGDSFYDDGYHWHNENNRNGGETIIQSPSSPLTQ